MLRFSSADRAWRATIAACIVGSKTAARRLPAALAVYIATSAFRSSSSACSPIAAGNGDADAAPDRDLLALDRERHLQRVDHPLRHREGALELDLVRQQDRELVAAQPGRQVVGPDAAPDPVRHGRQEPVAGRVAERVVDDLEVVEVEEQHDACRGLPAER